MVTVTVSETYDLSTKLDKMSIVGIHTPSAELLRKTFPGLIINNRFFKLIGCSLRLACASVLPADPLQVSIEAGKIAPQDMFNPILYKAMTNDGMGLLDKRIAGLKWTSTAPVPAIDGESVTARDDLVTRMNDFQVYYNLLSNRRGWKIAHPQNGLAMNNLKPLLHERLYVFGDQEKSADNETPGVPVIGNESNGALHQYNRNNPIMYGKARPMPRMNTTYLNPNSYAGGTGSTDPISGGEIIFDKSADIPQSYVAGIILPPAKQHVLYYRLVVRWKVAFFGIRPIQEIESFTSLSNQATEFYKTNYVDVSKSMDTSLDMVDTKDAEIEKIMEGI